MFLSVLIPSYRRPTDLERCLGALSVQDRRADQILVVVRIGDEETSRAVRSWHEKLPLMIVEVTAPGQVHALNAGLAQCKGHIVAITDDDAAPRPDWLARIEVHFEADDKLGGVGGRDWVHQNGGMEIGQRRIVGKVQWFGRVVGHHHLGAGPAREVDTLKGANCAFRMSAIGPVGFNSHLRGTGAQVHNDMAASLAVRRAGWRLVYDPEVAVDHYPAARFDRDARGKFDAQATADRAYNFRVALAEISPLPRRLAAMAWHYAVGTRDEPGVLNGLRMIARREPYGLQKFLAAHRSPRES
jgi:cellulose synthase/poly-beta-1,6-N-acetylglucosamine synthase-like glycosyltransferase